MRRSFLIIATVNTLYVVLLVVVFWVLPRVHPQPVSEIRSRLQSAPTFEELQRRAVAAGAAIEASDKVIVYLYQALTNSLILGIAWAVLNTVLVWLLFRHPTLKV